MKILTRSEFIKLPAGIVYTSGIPWLFGRTYIKGESCYGPGRIGYDWWETDMATIENDDTGEFFSRLEEMKSTGKSYPLQIQECRNGFFEEQEMFLVYEAHDLKLLLETLKSTIPYEA